MRALMMILSITSFAFLSACCNCDDMQRQINLLEQSNRVYAVKENPANSEKQNSYEFCGNEQFPCPTKTQLSKTNVEKQPNETTSISDKTMS